MAGKDGDDDDDGDGGAESSPPDSLRRDFPCTAPAAPGAFDRFQASFHKLMRKFSGLVWSIILAVLGKDRGTAVGEELVQEVFVASFVLAKEGRIALDPEDDGIPRHMGPTLSSITHYRLKRYIRHRDRDARRAVALEAQALAARASAEPIAPLQVLAREVLDQLSTEEQELFCLDAAGFTNEEMAERLGVPLGTLKTRLRAVRAKAQAIHEPERKKEPKNFSARLRAARARLEAILAPKSKKEPTR